MKIIFLDFDGVIQTLRLALAEGTSYTNATPDPATTKAIARCCTEGGCRIVVSSSWRDNEQMCRAKLLHGDIEEFLHEDWRTKEYASEPGGSRPEEIAEWLSRHPEVTGYAILDDDPWKWTPEQQAVWIQCSPYDGLMSQEMRRLLEWAGVPLRKAK